MSPFSVRHMSQDPGAAEVMGHLALSFHSWFEKHCVMAICRREAQPQNRQLVRDGDSPVNPHCGVSLRGRTGIKWTLPVSNQSDHRILTRYSHFCSTVHNAIWHDARYKEVVLEPSSVSHSAHTLLLFCLSLFPPALLSLTCFLDLLSLCVQSKSPSPVCFPPPPRSRRFVPP